MNEQSELDREQTLSDLDQSIADREQARADGDQDQLDAARRRLDTSIDTGTDGDTDRVRRLHAEAEIARAQERRVVHQDQIELAQRGHDTRQDLLDSHQATLDRTTERSLTDETADPDSSPAGQRARAALERAESARKRADAAAERAKAAADRS